MLGDPTSIYFSTELRVLPIEEFQFGKTFARELYSKLAEAGGYPYEDLSLQASPHVMSTKRVTQRGAGHSTCKIFDDRILVEETLPELTVEQFIEIVETVRGAAGEVGGNCPPIFGQRCVIRCLAKPLNSKHSVSLLAGRVSNVLDAIDPFERPPMFFGIRFRFPPIQIEEEGTEGVVEEKGDFVAVRFETWAQDIQLVWMEVMTMNIFPEPIEVTSDSKKFAENITEAYEFLTGKCVRFLNQFDDKPGAIDDKEETED